MLEGSGEGVHDGLEQNTLGIRKRLGHCAVLTQSRTNTSYEGSKSLKLQKSYTKHTKF